MDGVRVDVVEIVVVGGEEIVVVDVGIFVDVTDRSVVV